MIIIKIINFCKQNRTQIRDINAYLLYQFFENMFRINRLAGKAGNKGITTIIKSKDSEITPERK